MVKVLNNLVNKRDVLSIIQGFTDIQPEDSHEYNLLDSLYNTIDGLVPLNIVGAGNINVICEDAYQMANYLEGRKDD